MAWNKIDHDFTYKQLGYDVEPNFQPCLKVSVYFKKLDSVSYEQFFGHWSTVHADLASATQIFRDVIQRYNQHHQTPEMKEHARSLGEGFLDYDGCTELWVKSWTDFMKFHDSEEYTAALGPDTHNFMALPMTYMVGRENLVVGDAPNEMGGSDGILKSTQ